MFLLWWKCTAWSFFQNFWMSYSCYMIERDGSWIQTDLPIAPGAAVAVFVPVACWAVVWNPLNIACPAPSCRACCPACLTSCPCSLVERASFCSSVGCEQVCTEALNLDLLCKKNNENKIEKGSCGSINQCGNILETTMTMMRWWWWENEKSSPGGRGWFCVYIFMACCPYGSLPYGWFCISSGGMLVP